MLNEDVFWSIIDDSLSLSSDQDEQELWLLSRLEKLSPEEIVSFHLIMRRLLTDIYTSDMWCAAYLMNGGCSDDGFEYFRCWLISKGKPVYYKAKVNPDSLVDQEISTEPFEFEGLLNVAPTAYENITDKSIFGVIDQSFSNSEEKYQSILFDWEEDDPETMQRICPKLFNKFS